MKSSKRISKRIEKKKNGLYTLGLNVLPSVLVPGLDLGVGQIQLGRQFHAILHAQVFLPLETLLERLQLMIGERRPGFSLFFAEIRTGISAVVVTVTCVNTHCLIIETNK